MADAATAVGQSAVTSVLPLHLSFASSASSACLAEILTLPLDTAKVRLQLQSLALGKALKYRGPFHTIRTIVKEEGFLSLFNGLTPGLHRSFIFTGIRLGLYDKVKQALEAGDSQSGITLGQRISLAVFTSAMAITLANPSDVLKVRYQAHNPNARRVPRRSALGQYLQITHKEGVVNGLYKGYSVNLIRNSVISASEIITYEIAKKNLIERLQLEDAIPVHLASGCCAGFMATVLGSPADVLGTKAMQKHGHYAGMKAMEIAMEMAKHEGFFSFYKGFWPNFCRIGSFNIAMWFFYEQIKSFAVG